MGPEAYARNIRYVLNGPKRKATIAVVSRISQGRLTARLLGHRDAGGVREWVRQGASVFPFSTEAGLSEVALKFVPRLAERAEADAEQAVRREFDLLGRVRTDSPRKSPGSRTSSLVPRGRPLTTQRSTTPTWTGRATSRCPGR